MQTRVFRLGPKAGGRYPEGTREIPTRLVFGPQMRATGVPQCFTGCHPFRILSRIGADFVLTEHGPGLRAQRVARTHLRDILKDRRLEIRRRPFLGTAREPREVWGRIGIQIGARGGFRAAVQIGTSGRDVREDRHGARAKTQL